MGAFNHVLVLLSFVFALALAHILSRIGELLLARRRVKFSGLQALAMANAATAVLLVWLGLWAGHTVQEWDLVSILVLFLVSTTIYFLCAVSTPSTNQMGVINMEEFYWENYRIFYSICLISNIFGIWGSIILIKSENFDSIFISTLESMPFILLSLLPLIISARWAQWVSGLGLLGLALGWMIIFSRSLH